MVSEKANKTPQKVEQNKAWSDAGLTAEAAIRAILLDFEKAVIERCIAAIQEYREQQLADRDKCVEAGRDPSPYDFRIIATAHMIERIRALSPATQETGE